MRKVIFILANRLVSFKGWGNEFGFQPLSDKAASPSPPNNWKKINDIYWLGHDLMWTIDVVYRLAPKKYIVHGLKQSLYHLNELPMAETAAVKDRLQKLFDEANSRSDEEWTPVQRATFAEKLRLEIIDELSRITERVQKLPQEGSTIG
ncbi:MAG: hypothetical protein L0209_03735 [candidate division Zixibacteria bacterium]|nr:hypothetical protein [candidate division Zixibacteria bacterium]